MDWILIVNISAILLSPLVAVLVTQHLERSRRKKNFRRAVLQTLLANRHNKVSNEMVQAINVVEFAFHDCPQVRKLFREYIDMLGNNGLTATDEGWSQINEKFGDLTTAMAKSAGLGKNLSYQDMVRVYVPQAFALNNERTQQLSDAMLNFFSSPAGGVVAASDDATNENVEQQSE